MEVSRKQKEELLRKVSSLVEQKYFDPQFDVPKWRSLVDARTATILNGGSAAEFEQQMHDLVSQLGSSHTAFYHRNWRPLPPRQSICATLQQCETHDGLRWMLQDVQDGGPAQGVGLEKGDLLIGIDGEEIRPPGRVLLKPGRTTKLEVRKADGTRASFEIQIPLLKPKQPFSTPQAVISSQLEPNIGYLKINMFPRNGGNRCSARHRPCHRILSRL
jgi:C-terminal processing protease CtpA/Prc